jgi:hypothetical protein
MIGDVEVIVNLIEKRGEDPNKKCHEINEIQPIAVAASYGQLKTVIALVAVSWTGCPNRQGTSYCRFGLSLFLSPRPLLLSNSLTTPLILSSFSSCFRLFSTHRYTDLLLVNTLPFVVYCTALSLYPPIPLSPFL